ncbi:unnamed protein product [Prorocentrum cordatum]|uniref:Anoctamin transmembrane domain-containing protein n=1 Tax=Prorocentrum cordatum TaxID=2364126 RepID=A0ABN9Y984_9DINO|nr:unnamed protein product [Polarella glacialis]
MGINAAQYFLFLQEYTTWLAVPAALGLVIHVAHAASGSPESITASSGASLFMFFMTIWSTLFVEHWKRRRFALNYKFGFHQAGERAYDPGAPASFQVGSAAMAEAFKPVCGGPEAATKAARKALELSNYSQNLSTLVGSTGKSDPVRTKNTVVLLTVKTIIPMVLLLGVVGVVIHLLLWIGDLAEKRFQNVVMQNLPVLLYLIVANVLEKVYLSIGAKLTDWEGHPIHTQHLKSLTAKAASFQLVNYLGWFVYVAFWMMDIALLQSQLWMFMTVKQVIALSMETLVPMAQHRWSSRREARVEAKRKKDDGKPADGWLRAECERQLSLGRVDLGGEYMQLAVLFATTTSFAVAFPLGPLLALLFTLVSRYSDAFKLLKLSQRAPPRYADSVVLDTWLDIFEAISTCAVCVNFGCWALAGDRGWSPLQVVLVEHAVLFFKFYASWAIPDRPVTVERKEVAIEALMHHSGQRD